MDPLATSDDLAFVTVGVVSSDAADSLLEQTSDIVRNYCKWAIDKQSYDVTLDGNGANVLLLPAMKVTAVASVTESDTALTIGTDCDWSASGVLERIGGCWPRKRRSVQVVFTAGYDPVPRDIVAVVTGLASRILSTRGGFVQQRIGSLSVGQTLTAGGGLNDYEQAILNRYRLP